MPKAEQLTEFERGQIAALNATGMPHRQIEASIRRSKTAVTNYLADPENHGRKKRSGRPKKVTPRDRRAILREASNNGSTSTSIKDALNLPCHSSTIKRVLKESPIHKYSKRRGKPTLKPVHKQARIEWAKHHMEFGQKWRNVIWSDEKKFNLDGPDGML
jgi:transposase